MTGRPSRAGRITVAEAGRQLSVSRKTVRNLLSKHKAAFPERVYGRGPGRSLQIRLLSPADLAKLAEIISCWKAPVS